MSETPDTRTSYYVVLQQATESVLNDPAGGWVHIGRWSGYSAEHAVRLAVAQHGNSEGTYVAVPARSWKPVTVQAVQTTVLKLDPS